MTAVLEAIGMEKRFPVKQQMLLRRRDTFQALQGIDLALYSGQTLGVVGESGSGKSTLGEIFGDLQQPTSGIVRYKGQDIRSLGEKEYRRFRRNVQYIFQNPKESMNPYYTVERILVEPMKILVDGFKPHKARVTVRDCRIPPWANIPRNSAAGNASALPLPAHCCSRPRSLSAMNVCPRWMCPFRRRS